MAFTRTTAVVDKISGNTMYDHPNEHGYTAQTLRQAFDKAGQDLKTFLNETLLPELEAATAAGNIGINAITGMTADDVQEALEELYTNIVNTSQGGVPDKGITTAKLDDGAVTTAKIASSAVTAAKIDTGAVTSGKIDAKAVTTAKIADGAVTETQLGSYAVTEGKINPLAVTTNKIGAKAVTAAKLADNLLCYRSQNIYVTTSAWSADNTYAEFPYRASLPVSIGESPANFCPYVSFAAADAAGGNLASVADSHSGGVYIYARTLPTDSVVVKTLELRR